MLGEVETGRAELKLKTVDGLVMETGLDVPTENVVAAGVWRMCACEATEEP